ncbi:translation initiation factor IF-1 [bacterium DOLZORAL124_38_8]|nr:MAG: translation initiation factor IF-1 [bacterium DOLZORAL124_38_8]
MANEDKIELEGVVVNTLPGSTFEVEITTEGFEGHKIRAKLSGKMRMYHIRIVPGDKVKCEVTPYNLEEGTITYRPR